MYIRWQSRKRNRAEFGRYGQSDVHWRAILVESLRVNGKPVQKHIAYLAGFTESAVAIPIQQYYLWEHIEERLDQLGNRISQDDRRRIEAALIEKLGKPPTKKQRTEMYRQSVAMLGEKWVSKPRHMT